MGSISFTGKYTLKIATNVIKYTKQKVEKHNFIQIIKIVLFSDMTSSPYE